MSIKTVTVVAVLIVVAACGIPSNKDTDDKSSATHSSKSRSEIGDALTLNGEATITITDVNLNDDNGDKVPEKGAWASINVTIESHKENLYATPNDFDIVDNDNVGTPGEIISRHPEALPLDTNGMPKGTKREGVIIFDIDPDRYSSDHGSITYSSSSNGVLTWKF